MRIYMFTSRAQKRLSAFASEADGSKLPEQLGPWLHNGVIEASEAPPHNFSRIKIESAIRLNGYQLWRLKEPPKDSSPAKGAARE